MPAKLMNVRRLFTPPRWVFPRIRLRLEHRAHCRSGPQGCIFIHIPKCAGVSINRALFGRPGYGHASIRDYQAAFAPGDFARFFKFAFVRNPWDRLASAYHFLKAGGVTAQDARFAAGSLARCDRFEAFVLDWVTPESIMSYWHFMPQCHFICDEASRCLMDFIGHYETLDADFATLCEKLGVQANLSHLNRRRHARPDYRSLYTPAMRRVVETVYARDIATLGYDFDGLRVPAVSPSP